jgi:sigma-B regulation protein RsbQ
MIQHEIIARNNIKVFGRGTQPMIFAHGYGCDQHMWRFLTPAFEEKYQIILFDHVGSGNSEHFRYDFEKYNSLQGYADDLIEICEALSLQNTIFVGHSVSSMIGILAATRRSDLFQELILIAPSPCYINDTNYTGGFSSQDIDELLQTVESNYLGWSSFITPVIINNEAKSEFSEELNNSFCSMDPAIAKHFAKVTFLSDNRKDLSKIKTTTLIIQCYPDIIAPVEVGEFMQKRIFNSKLITLPVPGHCPHLTDSEAVIQTIQEYLTN